MKEGLRLILVLMLFCAVSGGLLAWTNSVTEAPIRKARQAEMIEALKRVLPECDNDVVADAKVIEDDGRDWRYYIGRRGGAFVGSAFRSSAEGYGGPIEALIGILPDGTIHALEILQADRETPGLGSKIKDADFRRQFGGRSATETRWAAVEKDGGQIHAITGATVSSRALLKAVKAGLDVYGRHAAEISDP